MRTALEVEALLHELNDRSADDLEDQDLDFEQWDDSSMNKAVRTTVDMAICMANGGGGTIVFGVADRITGRDRAIIGVPPEVDVNRLKQAVYDATDPKLTPEFEELRVPEGTGRLLVMQVHPGMPPYTDTSGRGAVRIGKNCMPLTGTLRRKLIAETGESDLTAEPVDAPIPGLISAAALDKLREAAAHERAPADLLQLGDEDLLDAVGGIRRGRLTPRRVAAGRLVRRHPGARTQLRLDAPSHVVGHRVLASRRRPRRCSGGPVTHPGPDPG